MKLIQFAGVVFLLVFANIVFAGTIVQIQNGGSTATILTDGKFARMNSAAADYVIVDYKKKTVKMVNPEMRQVMLLDADKVPAGSSGSKLRTSIKRLGAGKNIAGYPTQKYAYSANGKSCGIIYGSAEVFQKKGMKELLQAMNNMMEKQQAMLGGFASMMDDCMLAEMKLSEHVNTIGVPMRTEKNGVVDSEVKSIKLNVELPADTFVIPGNYKTVTMDQKIREVKQQVQQYQPQVQQMMQQVQQSGQMPPEVMEQMRRAQQMMQQYQQR